MPPPRASVTAESGRTYRLRPGAPAVGSGVSGTVYELARGPGDACELLFKQYHPGAEPDEAHLALARAQAAVAASGQAPLVCWCLDVAAEPPLGVVVERAAGATLQSVLDDVAGYQAVSPRDRLRLARAVAEAARQVEGHAQARDWKAGNLVAERVPGGGWRVRVIDADSIYLPVFRDPLNGVSYKAADTPEYASTPGYRPPEKVLDPGLDYAAAATRFMVAVTLFEVLHDGCHPCFPGGVAATGLDMDEQVGKRAFVKCLTLPGLPPPDYRDACPKEVDGLFALAFLGDAGSRPSAAAWCDALDAWLASPFADPKPAPARPRTPKRPRRRLKLPNAAGLWPKVNRRLGASQVSVLTLVILALVMVNYRDRLWGGLSRKTGPQPVMSAPKPPAERVNPAADITGPYSNPPDREKGFNPLELGN